MRICATSDTHGYLPEIPDCDVFVHAGDWSASLTGLDLNDWFWLKFYPWMEAISKRAFVVWIAGNHDFAAQDKREIIEKFPGLYLEDSSMQIDGTLFWGTPWTPYFCDWAFNAPEFDQGEEFLNEKFKAIPY